MAGEYEKSVIKSRVATFVVMGGPFASDVASIAREHVALDTVRRRLLLPGDPAYPSAEQIGSWQLGPGAAAVVIAPDGSLSDILDHRQATSGAWIEHAFVRALR